MSHRKDEYERWAIALLKQIVDADRQADYQFSEGEEKLS
jgi:hypothetical protein